MKIKDDELEATRNLAIAVDEDTMELGENHLHRYKYVDSGLTHELVKDTAWLLGSSMPKATPKFTAYTEAQDMHGKLCV